MVGPKGDITLFDASIPGNHLPEGVMRCIANYQTKMARTLFEISCLDGLEELSTARTLPSHLLRLFRKAVALYDESTHYVLGQMRRHGLKPQCKPGCTHCCCHMPTGISTIELVYLYHGLHQIKSLPRLFRRCLEAEESWVEIFHQNRNAALSLSHDHDDSMAMETMLKSYLAMDRPCPLLQSGCCLVYAYRPFACRMHFSLSPPHWCLHSHFQHEYAVRFNLEPGECVFDMLERLDGCFQLNLSNVMVCGLLELMVNVMQFEEIRWL
jgi:Fe-S-cluster containining protein